MTAYKAVFYRTRAEEMRKLADKAQSESQRLTYLRLEASWQRLADAADKSEGGDDGPGAEEDDGPKDGGPERAGK